MKKIRNFAVTILFALFIGGFFLLHLLLPDQALSYSERRTLRQAPKLQLSSVMDTTYFSDAEKYLCDQFPFREPLRKLKAAQLFYVFGRLDNNGICLKDDVAFKLDYKLNEDSILGAAEKFNLLKEQYLSDMNVYYSVIPEKSWYLAQEYNYPQLDMARLETLLSDELEGFTYLDIKPLLKAADYYATDLHWKQESISQIASFLLAQMGAEDTLPAFTERRLTPFYGAYYGQASLPMAADTLCYLQNPVLEEATVFDYEKNSTLAVYNESLFTGMDGYDVFLAGAKPLLKIDNPNATTDKELLLFRDSFSSSLAPLLLNSYKSITLIDLRYISSPLLKEYITFEDQDVLFLYCSTILNSSDMLKVMP